RRGRGAPARWRGHERRGSRGPHRPGGRRFPAPAGPRSRRRPPRPAPDRRADRARGRSRGATLQAARQHRLHASLSPAHDPRLRAPRAAATGRPRPRRARRRGGGMTALGERIRALRTERQLQQRQLAEKAGLTPSMVSQIESGRLSPSLNTVGKLAAALGIPIASLFDGQPAGRIQITRKKDYPVVSFEGTSERWAVLGAGLFDGKIRAVVSTLAARSRGVKTEKVVIKPGQMKLFYVIEGEVALHYNGGRHPLEAGDSALLDGGTPHGWENLGTRVARALWV